MPEVKKALIERLLYLNSKTNAFENVPHKVTSEELSKSLKQAKLIFNSTLALSIFGIGVYIFLVFPIQETFLRGVKIFPFGIIILIQAAFKTYIKIQKIKEQIFLQGVIDKIEHGHIK